MRVSVFPVVEKWAANGINTAEKSKKYRKKIPQLAIAFLLIKPDITEEDYNAMSWDTL